ncbi:tyrosine-type recombinase/integrase [Halobacillus naozhouensis]|uniref:Tyrosine-type recombinase/integrase n=1 Tax=Halobacillus naozhouensis TaxID=554880 RepID=A0ABY8J127_9BACI|nr:tyrosine-type recombinase/integrase [Halobacillus naozhouensis]WFT76202.1 tyrosine-type recombinase/integrase [Halobacillus naozhouensis]
MASYECRGKKSFLLTVELGYDGKGRRKRKRKTIQVDESLLKTKRKLENHLNDELVKFKIEVEAGEYISPGKLKLKDFVEDWEIKYAQRNLGAQTLETYKGNLRNHILPAFGDKRVDQIKTIHVVNFISELEQDSGLSQGTIQYIYRVFRNVMQRAKDWDLIKKNPLASVGRPKDNKKRKVNIYEPEEVQQLFEVAQSQPKHWRLFLSLALACAMRRSELLGLEWKHVDLIEGTIEVEQVITRGEKGRAVIKEPKSETSKRIISLPKSVIAELKLFRIHWKKEKIKAGEWWIEKNHEFVFCNEDGQHFYPTTPTTWWRRFIKKADVRFIRLHDLRHTSATTLINQGIHAKIISERLGHSDIRITMDTYGHAIRTADQEAASKMDEVFYSRKNS